MIDTNPPSVRSLASEVAKYINALPRLGVASKKADNGMITVALEIR